MYSPRHRFAGSDWPHGIKMSQQQDPITAGTWTETGLQNVSKGSLPMQFNAGTERTGMTGNERYASINSGFVVGGRLGANQSAREFDQRSLFPPGSD
jgi:hypothetical protein